MQMNHRRTVQLWHNFATFQQGAAGIFVHVDGLVLMVLGTILTMIDLIADKVRLLKPQYGSFDISFAQTKQSFLIEWQR
jgi:hypothetical protein